MLACTHLWCSFLDRSFLETATGATQVRDTVHVIVSCTNRKARPVPSQFCIRTIKLKTLRYRVHSWIDNLKQAGADVLPASDLYCGEHWAVVKSLASTPLSKTHHVRIWVCSAGYGLVDLHSPLIPYSATFDPNHRDAVAPGIAGSPLTEATQAWWRELGAWSGPTPGNPRSITQLVRKWPRSSVIVALSPPYLRALAADIEQAVGLLRSPHQLIIISAGSPHVGPLRHNLLPCDARLQHHLRGSRHSLNARAARELLRGSTDAIIQLPSAKVRFETLLSRQPSLVAYNRRPMTDEQVVTFIARSLRSNPNLTHTRLLRTLRDRNRACEQKRFASLFRKVQEKAHGQKA